jgi:biopolymer transport protein ExbD
MKRALYYGTVSLLLLAWFGWKALQPDRFTLRVGADVALTLDGEPMTIEALAPALRQRRERWPDVPLVIAADPRLPASEVLVVVDRAAEAGYPRPRFEVAP